MECFVCQTPSTVSEIGGTAFRTCDHCGAASLVRHTFAADYWGESIDHVTAFWTSAKAAYFSSALKLLETKITGRRLLDIGGGIGHFARLALDRGWDAYSLDVSPGATQKAAETIGSARALSRFDEAEAGTYDVVTMWCVVAHVPDPRTLIANAAGLTAPRGAIWVTTPNFAFQRSYARLRARARRPIDFAAHGHIHHFTTKALQFLGAEAGLSPWEWHYRGITEFCAMSGTPNRLLLAGKRGWNVATAIFSNMGGPNFTSELQGLAFKPEGRAP